MILQALTRYYDILLKDDESDIAPPGYSAMGISFALNISAKGELLDVFPLFEQVHAARRW
jgi:CRISPR-associated protein Csd1